MRNLTELVAFLEKTMSMTGVYQPVVILKLLEGGGAASKANLAQALSGYDESVQDYYKKILMRWPYRTLTNHDVVAYDRKSATFSLNFPLQDASLVEHAKRVCQDKIEEWTRKQPSKATPKLEASKRYRVLKAARGKCELCGIPAKVSPIDVDHIVPKSKADRTGYVLKDGTRLHVDDERNLQALCFRCNRAKRDQDSTDFRTSAKLVRDRIPEIIRESGKIPKTRVLRGETLKAALLEKLAEEHAELLAETNLEEMVDVMEVLLALAKTQGYTEEEAITLLHKKRLERGGFDDGIFLTEVAAPPAAGER